MMVRNRLSVSLALVVAGLGGSGAVQAAAGYSAGYATGFQVGCDTCSTSMETAFSTIRTAINLSEQAIGAAINEGTYMTPAPVGFPMLQSQINGTSADTTHRIVTAIEGATRTLSDTITRQPAIRQAIKEDQRIPGPPEVEEKLDAQGGCQSMQYGRVLEKVPRSSLGWGYQYVIRGSYQTEDGESVGESVAPPSEPPEDSEGVEVMLADVNARADQATNRELTTLRSRAVEAGVGNPTIGGILDPSFLYAADKRTLEHDGSKDAYGISDDERADYLIQYLTVDAPTHADSLGASASTPAELNAAVDGQIHNMEFAMSMAALDDIIKLRRPRSGTTGPDAFLAEAMGEEAPETSSQDDFWYRITHYRQRDLQWMGRTMVDDDYALAQQVQMEAEHLALKYERWKTKRTNTLLLAQAVANVMESEGQQ